VLTTEGTRLLLVGVTVLLLHTDGNHQAFSSSVNYANTFPMSSHSPKNMHMNHISSGDHLLAGGL
jgi:hypothetical protein